MMEPSRQTTLQGVDDRLKHWWADMLTAYRALNLNCTYRLIETIRSAERQTWLYGVGRSHSLERQPVTWVLTSNHQQGQAIDAALFDGERMLLGSASVELDLYRHVVDLGVRVAALRGHDVHNLGLERGKDWFHWEVR